MNLVTKTNKYYLIFFLCLFPIMVAVDYYLIKYVVNKEVDKILQHESERIAFSLSENGTLPPSSYLLAVTPIDNHLSIQNNKVRDTLIYEPYKDRLMPHRTYSFKATLNFQDVNILLKHPLLEMNELIVWLFTTTSFIILLLVVGLFLINQAIYKWAWKPFFENISKLTNYDITQKALVQLENSNITEFQEFNQIVTVLMNQVRRDFQNLKELNENMSHEIQTPLAIIRNKMVMLLESQNLNEKELQWVQTVYEEANKLSKIGKSLTLISRIENQEFTRLNNVDVSAVIENIIDNMDEMIAFKNLKMTFDITSVKIKCDLILANILFTNLIKNAIQHNYNDGSIEIALYKKKFEIINTGEQSKVEKEQLFNRFERDDKSLSLGLGLAINQKICELYGFRLDYDYFDGKHKLCLYF